MRNFVSINPSKDDSLPPNLINIPADTELEPNFNDQVLRANILETLDIYRRQINLHADEINSLKEVKKRD